MHSKLTFKKDYELQFIEGKVHFGALNGQSIAWKTAEKVVEEGAKITLTNTPITLRMGELSGLAEKLNCEIIPADATNVEDLETVFRKSMEILGGPIDFVYILLECLQIFVRKKTYDNLES